MTPTNAELLFWIIACILALVFIFIILPLWNNHVQNQEAKRMLSHYDYTEYHDDMEDWQ